MTQQMSESVSALFDDEAHRQDIERLIDKGSDGVPSDVWHRYQCIRSLLVDAGSADLSVNLVAEIRQRIDQESPAEPAGRRPSVAKVTRMADAPGKRLHKKSPGTRSGRVAVKGFALAASLVLMVVAGFQLGKTENPGIGNVAVERVAQQASNEPDAAVVASAQNPVHGENLSPQVSREVLLENYLRWHAEQASMTGPPATLPVARLASYGSGSQP